jgi:hypothetical protein
MTNKDNKTYEMLKQKNEKRKQLKHKVLAQRPPRCLNKKQMTVNPRGQTNLTNKLIKI